MGARRPGDSKAWVRQEPAGVSAGTDWFDASRIADLSDMHDHFYKVLWKLLKRLDRSAPQAGSDKETTEPQQGHPGKRAHALAFAGCEGLDGASTMAFNFAQAFSARSSKRVILVDGNVREPGLHHLFKAGRLGLGDLIRDRAALHEAITEVIPEKYYFLQTGQTLENPIALYESEAFAQVVEDLRNACDLLIFDSPPLMDAPEAAMLASRMDGLIMVLQADRTRWELARAVQEELTAVGVPILGVILNKREEVIPDAIRKRLWPYHTPFWQG